MTGRVLLIAADEGLSRQARAATAALGLAMDEVADVDEALLSLRAGPVDLVICGFETFEAMRQQRPGLYALLVVDAANSSQTIEAMKRGALDCLVRPLRQEELQRRLSDAIRITLDAAAAEPKEAGPRPATGTRIVGQSPAMQAVYKQIGLIAPRPINVLITGESGTGKELVARSLVEHSQRSDKPFLAINCAAIPETLLESELFGYERGAFTGADRAHAGKFEQCDGGTLFLDEVGDLPPATQAKLLRVLQEGTFQRLGSSGIVKVDVRIIAATHQALETMVRHRQFRQDLYYRLKVASIHVPPLRDREVDAVLLAHYFVDRLYTQGQAQVRSFSPDAVAALLKYPWPGNVRELENVVKSAAVVARGPVFRADSLPPAILDAAGRDAAGAASEPGGASMAAIADAVLAEAARGGGALSRIVAQAERAVILAALERCNGRAGEAAAMLGVSRTTLRKKMRDYAIHLRTRPETDQIDPARTVSGHNSQ